MNKNNNNETFTRWKDLGNGRSVLQAREGDSTSPPKVFVIYGHDERVLNSVESLLHRIGCAPLIFKRLKIVSKTAIEVLEQTLPEADAVIALLTPDDEGRKRGGQDGALEMRARQNVLVEAGYAVISNRSRSIIVALGGVSIPSDFDGIQRVQSDQWSRTMELDIAKALGQMLALPLKLENL